MAALFVWPPDTTIRLDANSGSFADIYATVNGVWGSPAYDTTSSYYRVGIEDRFANRQEYRAQGLVTASGLMFGGQAINGRSDNTAPFTTTDGIVLNGGAGSLYSDFRNGHDPEFGPEVWSWGSTYDTGSVGRGYLIISNFGSSNPTEFYANTPSVTAPMARQAVRTSANIYFGFTDEATCRYIKFTKPANTFGAWTSLGLGTGFVLQHMISAGEGYFYAISWNGTFMSIRGVNFASGSPVVTAVLGGSGSGAWTHPALPTSCVKYVVRGSNRVIGIVTPGSYITITFTSGTKATPTIVRTSVTWPLVPDTYLVEHDPTGPRTVLVACKFTDGGQFSVPPPRWDGAYIDLDNLGAGVSASASMGIIDHPALPETDFTHHTASAQLGESAISLGIAGLFSFNSNDPTVAMLWKFWHTPINFDLTVDVTSTTTSVELAQQITRERGVPVSSGYTSVTSGVSLTGAHADTFQWKVESSSEITASVSTGTGYSSVSLDAVAIQIFETAPLCLYWTNTGYTWMDDFMVYVNQDRAAVGLPPCRTFGLDGKFLANEDIATYQATQAAVIRQYSHDSARYYPGYQTFVNRASRTSAKAGAENLLLTFSQELSSRIQYGYATPFTAWQAWHNSPGHYANIIRNWGEDNIDLYGLMGVAEGWGPTLANSDAGIASEGYMTVQLCNVFLILETQMFETNLQQFWDNAGALVGVLQQQWSNDSWVNARSQMTTSYSLHVSAQHSVNWGARVAREHEAAFSYSVLASAEFPYSAANPIGAVAYSAPYRIRDTSDVVAFRALPYALSVASSLDSGYALLYPVQASLEASYRIRTTSDVRAEMAHLFSSSVATESVASYGLLSTIRAQNEAGYRIRATDDVRAESSSTFSLSVSASSSADYSFLQSVRAQVESGYAIRATQDAKAEHTSPYSLSIAAALSADYVFLSRAAGQHQSDYAIRATEPVRVQSEAGWSLRLSAESSIGYALLGAVRASHEAGYRIADTQPVTQANDSRYSVSVTAASVAPYAVTLSVAGQLESGYAIFSTEPVAQQSEVRYGLRIGVQHQSGYAINGTVARETVLNYSQINPVRTEQQTSYAILAANPIKVAVSHPYAMQDYVAALVTNSAVRLVLGDGTVIVVDDGVIESSESDIGYTFECRLTELAVFSAIHEDDPIVVDFCGELYDFFVTTKSMTRNGPTDITFGLSATNAVVRTGKPYAQETDYIQDGEQAASELVDGLVEIDFTYEIVDWTILAGRLQVSGATQLEAVQQIAEAAGGVVDGNIDGSMRLRYPYPVAMNALDSAGIDQYYSDDYDNLSVSVQTQYRDGANRFRIREGDASFADSMEWVPDERQTDTAYQTGIVKAYLSPYRNSASIVHLGNAVYVTQLGETEEYKEELIEFNEGVGNVSKPIHQLLSVEWITASMGAPSFTPYSTLLNVGVTVNQGYGLAKVTYNAKHLTARAAGVPANVESGAVGPASSYAYFILEESNG